MAQAIGCTHYELIPCDREPQILSTISQVVEPSTVSLRDSSHKLVCQSIYPILFSREIYLDRECGAEGERATASRKQRGGSKPCFEGQASAGLYC
jgi:hypothetical protein